VNNTYMRKVAQVNEITLARSEKKGEKTKVKVKR
jgi:hypothetical protein